MNSRYLWLVLLIFSGSLSAQQKKTINLPSSKKLMAPAPGDPRAIGSLPTNIVVSPDGKYAAILENGYGTRRPGSAARDRCTEPGDECHR